MSKVAIVEDNIDFANHLSKELSTFAEIGNVAVFDSGKAFLRKIDDFPESEIPQIVLMDVSMETEFAGIETTKIVKDKYPLIQVIMLTLHEDEGVIFEAFKVGAVGYLLKDEKTDFIAKAILDVQNGGSLMSASIARKTIHFFQNQMDKKPSENKQLKDKNEKIEPLSERELEILNLIGKGYTYQKVADVLFISLHTVKTHLNNIFKKLKVSNKIDALRKKDFLF